jgi:hypothetical protein
MSTKELSVIVVGSPAYDRALSSIKLRVSRLIKEVTETRDELSEEIGLTGVEDSLTQVLNEELMQARQKVLIEERP